MVHNMTIGILACPAPFINELEYPHSKGWVAGRICSKVGETSCCLPCPVLDWFYPDDLYHKTKSAGWIGLASLLLTIMMLVSWACLPATKTKRHYLNVSLVVAILILELGVSIPVMRKPARCADPITPSSPHSSMTCAWAGALLIFGFAAVDMWILVRAVYMHLLIVWDITPPAYSFIATQIFAWVLSGVILTTAMVRTGVSCRLGDYCHPNGHNSWASGWGPLLGFAGITTILTVTTAGYCLYVYLKSLFTGSTPAAGSQLNTPTTPRPTTMAVWQRVQAVVKIQWRPIAITVALLIEMITTITVFTIANHVTDNAQEHPKDYETWIGCLVLHPTDKNACAHLLPKDQINLPTLVSPMILLGLMGIVAFLVLSTRGMATGWFDYAKTLGSNIKRPSLNRKSSKSKSKGAVNKKDISLPTFPRFSFSPGPNGPEVGGADKSLTMAARPGGGLVAQDSTTPLNASITAEPRYSQSLAEDTGFSSGKEFKTPVKRSNAGKDTPSRVSIQEWDPSASNGGGVGPLHFHPVDGDEHDEGFEDAHEGGHGHDEDDLWGDTPSKQV